MCSNTVYDVEVRWDDDGSLRNQGLPAELYLQDWRTWSIDSRKRVLAGTWVMLGSSPEA